MKRRYFSSRTRGRKTFQAISSFGLSALFLLIPFTNCSKIAFIGVLIAAMLPYGLSMGGSHSVPTDLSNQYAAIIYSINNMVCTTAGFVPEIVGPLLDGSPYSLKHTWWYIFAASALINIGGGVVFLAWGSSEPQPWTDNGKDADEEGSEI